MARVAKTRPAAAWATLKYLEQKVATAEASHRYRAECVKLMRSDGAKLSEIRAAEWECAKAAGRLHVARDELAEFEESIAPPAKTALVG